RTHDTNTQGTTEKMDREDKTTGEQVAWVKRGDRVAQATWKEKLGRQKTFRERVCSLPYKIRNTYKSFERKILRPELFTEGEEKEVKRVTRGFSLITYNLEVEDTHCLLVDGVIAHNSMDAISYGFCSIFAQPATSIEETRRVLETRRERMTANDSGL
ncbi:MAG TPA: hypothetical protein ENI63_01455, partial [Candidatus Kaiserbacteria bacterium]|nr:hypothetical protein [Candidatus Kaiserbacteria bacterium]